jgi:hypothetical protein
VIGKNKATPFFPHSSSMGLQGDSRLLRAFNHHSYMDQPTLATRKRKVLRPNPIAPWELRLGDIRVFYEVQEEPKPLVIVKAVAIKRHNELWIGDERIEL